MVVLDQLVVVGSSAPSLRQMTLAWKHSIPTWAMKEESVCLFSTCPCVAGTNLSAQFHVIDRDTCCSKDNFFTSPTWAVRQSVSLQVKLSSEVIRTQSAELVPGGGSTETRRWTQHTHYHHALNYHYHYYHWNYNFHCYCHYWYQRFYCYHHNHHHDHHLAYHHHHHHHKANNYHHHHNHHHHHHNSIVSWVNTLKRGSRCLEVNSASSTEGKSTVYQFGEQNE